MSESKSRHDQNQAQKDKLAQAMVGGDYYPQPSESDLLLQESEDNTEIDSEKSESFTEMYAKENQANNAPEHSYSHLDQYSETDSENLTETISETAANDADFGVKPVLEIEDEDAEIMAGFGVSSLNGLLPMVFGAPVSMPEDQQEQLAIKAMPLIKKYYSGDNVPAWLKKYQDEIGFGMVLSTAMFGCWQQSKEHKKTLIQKKKNAANDSQVDKAA